MSCRTPKHSPILLTLSSSTFSQKEGGPTGHPRRRENPSRTTGTSDGRGEREASQSPGMKRRDLLLLRWRPTAAERSPGGHHQGTRLAGKGGHRASTDDYFAARTSTDGLFWFCSHTLLHYNATTKLCGCGWKTRLKQYYSKSTSKSTLPASIDLSV